MHNKSNSFCIGNKRIGINEPVFIIAEVGINHHGDVDLCSKLIEAAAASGADAVKLQTVDAEQSYVAGTISHSEFKDKSLNDVEVRQMIELAEKLGIILFSTPGDFNSLDRMTQLGMPAVKISSGLMTNKPLIAEAARRGLPLIISTGMAYEHEIETAINTAKENCASGIAVLKCTALYPAPDNTINLAGMLSLKDRFDIPVGYSDHTLDDLACTSAVAFGATVIEKHFTLDKTRKGADHHISMEPKEFTHLVSQIRRLQDMRGDGKIAPTIEEENVRSERHRCLIAGEDINVGEIFTIKNVALKRPIPGKVGLPPSEYEVILGKTATVSILRDHPICHEHVEEQK